MVEVNSIALNVLNIERPSKISISPVKLIFVFSLSPLS
jgi:hypothetical protein